MKKDGPGGRMGGPSSWSMVTWLMIANGLVYLFQHLLFYRPGAIDPLALVPERFLGGHVYQLLTYQFSHANLFHLVVNMLLLFFLGRFLERIIPGRQILAIYLLGGFAGGLVQLGFDLLLGDKTQIVGASASVLAIVFALIAHMPNQVFRFLLFFVVPVRLSMKQIGLIFIAVDLVTLVFQYFLAPAAGDAQTRTGVFAHFGGMAAGWLYFRHVYPRLPRLNVTGSSPSRRSPRARRAPKTGRKFGIRIVRNEDAPGAGNTDSPGGQGPYLNPSVDAILDKISEQGMQSLTADERRILEKSSKKLARKLDSD